MADDACFLDIKLLCLISWEQSDSGIKRLRNVFSVPQKYKALKNSARSVVVQISFLSDYLITLVRSKVCRSFPSIPKINAGGPHSDKRY